VKFFGNVRCQKLSKSANVSESYSKVERFPLRYDVVSMFQTS